MRGMKTMNLDGIVHRDARPEPWAEGDNIPWNEPGFSKRMLEYHLSQEHDAASRRLDVVDRQVEWIHNVRCSPGGPRGCLTWLVGRGFMSSGLRALGHTCAGIDFSPASVAHARANAEAAGHAIGFTLSDLREAQFPSGQDLVLLLFGEMNVFSPEDAGDIVRRAAECLVPGGRMVLEPHAPGVLERNGTAPPTWGAEAAGLWSDRPHVWLQENFWYADRKVAICRWLVIDTATSETTLSSASYQDYDDAGYESLLVEGGFRTVARYASLTGGGDDGQGDFVVVVGGR